jgi:MurNAc alpha-1-phosphate uridylyltransferase
MQLKSAMIFAAGFGTRMGPLTKTMPKPLVPVLGKTMIGHSLQMLTDAGVTSVFVNTHYFADQMEEHLSSYPYVTTIHEEPDILETGGGLKNALLIINDDPVITLNCDAVWFGDNPVAQLMNAWSPDAMDGLLMLLERPKAYGHKGSGDFYLAQDARLEKKGARADAPYIYAGLQILKTELLSDIHQDCFSISLLWDKMFAANRIFGTVYDGEWVDVGHPDGIKIAERKAFDV